MIELRGIIFGPAYESWIRLSQKWESNSDILTHLFDIHDEFCKQCVESRTNACGDSFRHIIRGNLEGQTSSSSNEGERPAKRRKIKAKRASQSSSLSSQIISIDSNTDNSDNDVVIVKEEFIDPEYIGSSTIDTQEQSKEYGQINTVITEDTDNSHSSCAVYLDESSLYKEALVDQIDVYVKEEPSDTEYSNKCSQEDFEPPVSEFAYIDDISVEKRPKLCVRKSRGVYQVYTSEEKAKIAKYAIENGIANAVRHFSKILNKRLRESTVRDFKKKYLSQLEDMSFTDIKKIDSKRRGRPRVPPPPPPESPPPPPLPPGERRKRGEYQKYTPEIKAALAKYAIDVGCAKASKYFSKLMNRHINESTIRSFRRSYLEQGNGEDLQTLECRKRGRPKVKPYSTQVIDHIIEHGSLPSKTSCREFLMQEEKAIKKEEEDINIMQAMIIEAQGTSIPDNLSFEGRDISYPVTVETVGDCEENKNVKETLDRDFDDVNSDGEEMQELVKNCDSESKQTEDGICSEEK